MFLKKPIVGLAIIMLIIYFASYFPLRNTEMPFDHSVIAGSLDPNSAIIFPMSLQRYKEHREIFNSLKGVPKNFPSIIRPRHFYRFFETFGVFERNVPIRYIYFIPAIQSEITFWKLYALMTGGGE